MRTVWVEGHDGEVRRLDTLSEAPRPRLTVLVYPALLRVNGKIERRWRIKVARTPLWSVYRTRAEALRLGAKAGRSLRPAKLLRKDLKGRIHDVATYGDDPPKIPG